MCCNWLFRRNLECPIECLDVCRGDGGDRGSHRGHAREGEFEHFHRDSACRRSYRPTKSRDHRAGACRCGGDGPGDHRHRVLDRDEGYGVPDDDDARLHN